MWEPKIRDWAKVKPEHAQFIFQQAEKKVDETIKTCEDLSKKLYSLLTLNLAIWVALCGFLFSNLYNSSYNKELLSLSIVAIVYILGIIVTAFFFIYPSGYFTSGSMPKDLFVQDFFNQDDKEISMMYMYSAEARNYQGRINSNSSKNNNRAKCIQGIIIADLLLPLILVLLTWAWWG